MNASRQGAVIVALSAKGAALGRRIQQILGAGEVLGLAGRVADCDRSFRSVPEALSEIFRAGRPIIGICASGILIRALGGILGDKESDPPVLAVAEDGSVVVPLLGGHHQGNCWAATLAAALGATAAITTASDVSLGVALDEPPTGWRLRAGDYKSVASRLLAGERARITVEVGPRPDWLLALPQADDAKLHILVSARADAAADLVYAPALVALGIGCERLAEAAEVARLVDAALAEANVAREAVACVASIALKAIEIMERENVLDNVRANEPKALELLEGLKDVPIVGDVRGMGHFFAIEVVKDQATREALTDDEAGWLLKDVLSDRLYEDGMICRLDDRSEPIVQIAPPLVADIGLFEEITSILRDALLHAAERLESGKPD